MKKINKLIAVILSLLLIAAAVPIGMFTVSAGNEPGDYTGGTEPADPGCTHNYVPVVTEPTCTEQGYTTYTCSICSDNYVADYTDALGHTGGTATCHSKAVCTRCHEEYGEFDANNHDGDTEIRDAVAANCTVAGYTGDTYCLGCGAKLAEGEVIDAIGHTEADTWSYDENYHWKVCTACDWVIGDAEAHTGGTATCNSKAICEVCGQEYGEFDPNNHVNTEVRDAKDATCTKKGYTGDTYCLDCGANIATGENIKALGHDYISVITPPTCTEQGYTTYTCSRCDYIYKGYYKDPLGHTATDWIIDKYATFTEAGSKHKECSACGEIIETTEIPVIDQSEPRIEVESKEAVAGKTASIAIKLVNNPGITSMKLMVNFPSELVLNSPVDYTITSIDGQATQPQTFTSPVTLNWVSPLANVTGDVVFATLNFTVADEAGLGDKDITVTYNRADVFNLDEDNIDFAILVGKITVIPCPHEDTTEYPAVASTCVTAGHGAYTVCNECGEIIEGSADELELDPNNHEGETEVRDAAEATCTEAGYTGDTYCLGCGAKIAEGETIDALGHTGGTATCHSKAVCTRCHEEYGEFDPSNHDGETEVRDAKDAACTEAGYTGDTYCLGCGAKIAEGETIDALGHTGGTATCHSKAVCTRCHEEYGEFDPSNHDGETEVRDAKDATCTEAGYTGDTYCLGCGAKIAEGETIDALGHTGGTATCHSKAVCTRCHEEYGEFDPNNHDGETEVRDAKEATATEEGYTGDTYCLGCGAKLEEGEVIPVKPSHIPGDINGDGSVNNKDLTRLFQYLSDWDVEVNEAALDVNGDGSVNNKDLTRLFQYLSDWDVEIF